MNKFFTYGIFTSPEVCKRALGRDVEYIESEDTVQGYDIKGSGILMAYPSLDSTAQGKVFEVSDGEVEVIDGIEGSSYKRINITTDKGHNAFMYASNDNS